MKSKIDYHVLSMDEIVFDNRNKSYGAFAVRQDYEKNLLKAMFIGIGLFALGMSSPAILKNIGLLAEAPVAIIKETKILIEEFPAVPLFDQTLPIRKPPSTPSRSDFMLPVEKERLPEKTDPVIDPTITSTSTGIADDKGKGNIDGGSAQNNALIAGQGSIPSSGSMIYKGAVQQMPEFIGGKKAFDDFVDENLPYPEADKADGIEGTVNVQFIVNEDGSIEQIKVAKTSGYASLDNAALRLVKSFPKYSPGKQNGNAVRVLCVLPITFEVE